jgi:ketosteroid isomerase-like protein
VTAPAPGGPLRALVEAYDRGDLAAVVGALADDLVAYVTTADGAADRVEGRQAYLARLPDLGAAGGSAAVTQVLEVDERHALAMVEVRAGRGDERLHNHAAFLARVEGRRITRLWMVEAQPSHSDQFWSRASSPG